MHPQCQGDEAVYLSICLRLPSQTQAYWTWTQNTREMIKLSSFPKLQHSHRHIKLESFNSNTNTPKIPGRKSCLSLAAPDSNTGTLSLNLLILMHSKYQGDEAV